MRILLAILLSVVFGTTPLHANNDPRSIGGYGKTRWGMTPEQVLEAEAPRAEKIEPGENYKGSLGLVSIDEIEIGVSKFRVVYLFQGSEPKLHQVNVTSVERKNHLVNASTFSNLERLLTEKYGEPTFRQEGKVVTWKMEKTSIDLRHLHIQRIASIVSVSYRPIEANSQSTKNL